MTGSRHGSRRRVSTWRRLVFVLPVATLTIIAVTLTAGPSEVFSTVSHGLTLVQNPFRSNKLRACDVRSCHPAPHPTPSSTRTAIDPPVPTVSPTHSATPTPTPTHSVTPTPSPSVSPSPTVSATATPTPTPTPTPSATSSDPPPDPSDPTSPPVTVCGNTGLLDGPSAAPAGAVTVPAGDNSTLFKYQLPANTTYYFAAGTHTLGSGKYSGIQANGNDTFIGAPGAILSGLGSGAGYVENDFAIGGSSAITGVTIEDLTIQDFNPPGSQGAVNPNSSDHWTIENDTIQDNLPGSAIMVGSNNTIEDNCLTQNGQYAFNAYQSPSDPESSAVTGGPQDITLSDNEISYNDTCNFETATNFPITPPSGCAGGGERDGCGCSGGGKFWHDQNVTVEDNYVHNNYNVGLWADTDNDGFDIQGNYFSANYAAAIQYEVSYNALIKNNTFVDNAWGDGAVTPSFPVPAIYVSESGGSSQVPNSFGYSTLDIEANTFTNNWGGVVLWENANRFCGDGFDAACTLVDPAVATMSSCPSGLANPSKNQAADSPDYFDMCRWKVQNTTVSDNVFNFNPSAIGAACTLANKCGFNGLFSEYGSTTPYTAWVVPLDISDHQSNFFQDNIYTGPWNFDGFVLGEVVSWSQWTAGFKNTGGSNDTFNGQDAGSTYNP